MNFTVFITGASSGIGAALAQEYARKGAIVGLVGRRREALETVRATMNHPEAHSIYALDVNHESDLHAAARDFMTQHGAPDLVIAAAGISVGTWTEYYEDLAHIRRVFETNIFAMTSTFHPFIAPMKAAGKGALVGIASVAGIRGLPGSEAYCASKAAVISYCESLRGELRGSGVSVLTVLPGYVATPLTEKNPYQMPFLLQPDEFARRAVRVIERKCSYAVIPWQMGIVAKLMRMLPNPLFDKLFAGKKYKPRADVLNADSANTQVTTHKDSENSPP